MLQELLFDRIDHIALRKSLDRAAVAQRVIASNVANVGTPGYTRMAVSFQEELVKALSSGENKLLTTHPNHIPGLNALAQVAPEVVMVEGGYWNGVNNVDIEQEMTDLAANQLDFDTAAQFLQGKFTNLRIAITGRR